MRARALLAIAILLVIPRGARTSLAASSHPLGPIGDISFVDANHGWLLGYGLSVCGGKPCPVSVRRTVDGGRTWKISGAPGTAPEAVGATLPLTTSGVEQIRFADTRDGWIFGPTLWVTHDGGTKWRNQKTNGNVLALEAVGGSVCAVEGACRPQVACSLSLYGVSVRADSWRRISNLPGRFATIELLRSGASSAWVLSAEILTGRPFPTSRLIRTANGGRAWQGLTDPCNGSGSFVDGLATTDGRTLWLTCGGEPGVGQQPKSVYVSPNQPWLALSRGTLITGNGRGKTWGAAIPMSRADPNGAGVGPIRFEDARHGWLVSFPDAVFRTCDGGRTWSQTTVR
jgi:photosystem II stability/assembly factor-like uncharacterized protein